MISERQFIRSFPEMWKVWLPNLTPGLLHQISTFCELGMLVEHWSNPLTPQAPTAHNDLIAEIAFCSFSRVASMENFTNEDLAITNLDISKAIESMVLIRGGRFPMSSITKAHLEDSQRLMERLVKKLLTDSSSIVEIHPRLRGYGFLSSCHPDIIQGSNLIEIKMSKYGFRGSDIKQLLAYATLAHFNEREINEVSLLNPRLGILWKFTLKEFVRIFSNRRPTQLFEEIGSCLLGVL
jgi:hypothetical protein